MNTYRIMVVVLALAVPALSGCSAGGAETPESTAAEAADLATTIEDQEWRQREDASRLKEIYFAGGCFWGIESYYAQIPGVIDVTVGYANGRTDSPTYEEVCRGTTGYAETAHLIYRPDIVSLEDLTEHFFVIVNPLSLNQQGNDVGTQYRSGIYYSDDADLEVIESIVRKEQDKYSVPIVTEVERLRSYFLAEEYHQDYLEKNPGGYCHVDMTSLEDFAQLIDPTLYTLPSEDEIRAMLTDEQYRVVVLGQTESAYTGEYDHFYEPGLYVDIVTGEPLFLSADKYDSGCGWPSFTRPIAPEVIAEYPDTSYGLSRTEVRSRVGGTHLGHVFDDGPEESGGLRYCINSAALRFIPYAEMEEEGYGYLMGLVTDADESLAELNPRGVERVASLGDYGISFGMLCAEVMSTKDDYEYRAITQYGVRWEPEAWKSELEEGVTIADDLTGKILDEMLRRLAVAAHAGDEAGLGPEEEEALRARARRDYASYTREELGQSGLTLEDFTEYLEICELYERSGGDEESEHTEEWVSDITVSYPLVEEIKELVFEG